jgi:hypothetical protein
MERLLILFGLDSIIEKPMAILEGGYIDSVGIKSIRLERDSILRDIRPDMIPLTDIFGFHDETLRSAIARSDG